MRPRYTCLQCNENEYLVEQKAKTLDAADSKIRLVPYGMCLNITGINQNPEENYQFYKNVFCDIILLNVGYGLN
jgi:hypothetical protein